MDGGILLNGVATNTTGTTLNYQLLTVIIAGVGFLFTLTVLVYNVGKELGELKGTKEIVERRLESFDQKYRTSEKIQEVHGKLETLKARIDAERAADKAIVTRIESQAKVLEDELRDHKRIHSFSNPLHSSRFGDSRIGVLQRIPAEESTVENLGQKFSLYINTSKSLGRISSVKISNRDEFGEKIVHEISIDAPSHLLESGAISRTLVALMQAFRNMKFIEDRIEYEITQELERMREEGKTVVRTPGALSKEDLHEQGLPGELKVRRSRYDAQDIFFIIKGTEKEDTATEPPFKIGVEGDGDFVSVSRENIRPLVEELTAISQLLL